MNAWHQFLLGHRAELFQRTLEHTLLTGASILLAAGIGLPLGILAHRRRRAEGLVLGIVAVLQTIPALAMLAFLMVALSNLPALPLIGRLPAIGTPPALIALVLYALLPLARATVTGLAGVPQETLEAADSLGMTSRQRLWLVELPLARPVILSGLRTATIIGVGLTTLSAFIGAGGLGVFINRGIYMSQNKLILLGAVPAAIVALILDQGLFLIETLLAKGPRAQAQRPHALRSFLATVLPTLAAAAWIAGSSTQEDLPAVSLRAGFTGEFVERPDGVKALCNAYGFHFAHIKDMEAALMYRALSKNEVDVISAYSTDGRIPAYHVRLLEDDWNFFPPYEAAPVVRVKTLQRVAGLEETLNLLAGRISAADMQRLNYEVDEAKRSPKDVAEGFLRGIHLLGAKSPNAALAPVILGGKAFTEGSILSELMAQLLETRLGIPVDRKLNLGGTLIVHNALKNGAVDVYAEYTGTALTAILNRPVLHDPGAAYQKVAALYPDTFGAKWLKPFGFNNTYALGVREADAAHHGWKTISDLKSKAGSLH